MTFVVAAGEGLYAGQRRVSENFGKDLMVVWSGRTSMQAGGMRAGRALQWQARDYEVVQQEATACRWVLPQLGNSVPVRSDHSSATLLVTASLPPFAEIRTIPVAEGRFYHWDDVREARRVAFLGSDARKQLFGSRPALGETVYLAGIPYLVIGVMQHKEQDSSYDGRDISKVFVPFPSALRDFPNPPPLKPDSVDRLLVTPRPLEHHEACKWQVRPALARLHDFDPRDEEAAGIWDTVENAKAFHRLTDGMKYFLGAIGLVSLLLGGIGVMDVMLVAVRERTREIGIRKAVGATSREILRLFFLETLIVVFVSGAAGMTVAYALCAAVNRLPMPQYFAGLLASWKAALLAWLLLGAVAVLSALYPARQAASVDPVEALRFEPGG
ncbi:MAG: ABC transporter permease [Bryobacterales bacterium]|nr:ABC transporter permease [Bryobacteraceae bacterium]MDW8130971.1 ABC transporter permease [Bryobacterales bacterium]